MAKVYSDGKIPKRIAEGYVNYPLGDDHIMRETSGFTKEGMKDDSKYAKSRENANEFGAVSRLCKSIRMALQEVLPKNNNLAVCNGLTQIMRKVMCCDAVSVRGNRCLKNGFATAAGKSLFTGYDFNPNSLFRNVFKGNYHFDIEKKSLQIDSFEMDEAFVFPESANCVGLRMGALRFNFDTSISFFKLTDWSLFPIESNNPEGLQLGIEGFPDGESVVFFLLEISFFVENDGSFIPFAKDETKVVFVLGVE